MTTLETARRTSPRLGAALLTLALAAATVAGYRAALEVTGEAVQTTLSHPTAASCSAHLAAARAGSRVNC
jgi:hypothetical protein